MSANDRQEGGDHYRTPESVPQHWDLARIYQWDPFQYQITKYVMRWKTKHPTTEGKLVDLKKARHFIDKYIEDYEAWMVPTKTPQERVLSSEEVGRVAAEIVRLGEVAMPDKDSDDNFQCEGWWGDRTQLYKCKRCGHYLRQASLSNALTEHGECPGRGYVHQGN